VNVLGVGSILTRLERRFDLLTSSARGIDTRQLTLRGAIEWSWELLAPWERAALAQCSVFRGAFTIEGAEHVIDLSAYDEAPGALDTVQALHDKSLVYASAPTADGCDVRFGLLESIREFAHDHLERSGECEGATTRHVHYYADYVAARAAQHEGAHAAQASLSAAREDLVAAHANALAVGDAARAITIVLAMEARAQDQGPHAAYIAMVETTIEAAARAGVNDHRMARLLAARAFSLLLSGEPAKVTEDAEAALRIARASSDLLAQVRVHGLLGQLAWEWADAAGARARVEALSALAAIASDPKTEGVARMFIGLLTMCEGADLVHAREQLTRASVLLSEAGDERRVINVLTVLGWVLLELGQLDEAEAALERAIAESRATDNRLRHGQSVWYLAAHRLEAGRPGEAIALCDEVAFELAEVGHRLEFAETLRGVALAMLDATSRAQWALDHAEVTMTSEQRAIARIHRGHLDLARARAAIAAGSYEEAARLRRAAEDRLGSVDERNDDLRFAARLLRRALDAAAPLQPLRPPANEALVVAHDGSWFRPPHGHRVDLGRRTSLRNVLRALIDRRFAEPGVETPAHALVEHGWPGERMAFEAGIARVRVVVSDLRKLGLRRVLQHFGTGYALDPEVPVESVREP
jgi:tetratricopeptide (TPR) repeat protein